MKISSETLQILKNFAQIHQSFLFKPGSTIATIDGSQGSVFAKAKVKEEFPIEAFIYDLNQLLMYLNTLDDPDLEWGDEALKISSSAGKFTFFYAATNLMKYKVPSSVAVRPFYTFSLFADDVALVNKAAAITSSPNIEVVSKGNGMVKLRTFNPKNATANTFEMEWEAPEDTREFRVLIPVDTFRLLPGDYEVSFSETRAVHFSAKSKELDYYVAMQPDSEI